MGGALGFVLEAVLLFLLGTVRGRLRFAAAPGPRALAGAALAAYGLVADPAIGLVAERGWPAVPLFGVTPCPVTLFTIGLLLAAEATTPRALFVVPALWGLIGGSAAVLLDVPPDWPLLAAAIPAAARAMRPPRPDGGPSPGR